MGWSEYQVRSDLAIRRHWALVCCAFAFCWYNHSQQSAGSTLAPAPREERRDPAPAALFPGPAAAAGQGEKQRHAITVAAPAVVAGGATGGAGVAGALDHAVALLARLVGTAPTAPTMRIA